MTTDHAIQISVKNARGDLLNVRGESIPEVQDHLSALMNDEKVKDFLGTFSFEDDADRAVRNVQDKFEGSKVTSIVPDCPNCGGPMWDNRANKRNPKGPDFTCKDKGCKNDDGFTTGVWLEKKTRGRDS